MHRAAVDGADAVLHARLDGAGRLQWGVDRLPRVLGGREDAGRRVCLRGGDDRGAGHAAGVSVLPAASIAFGSVCLFAWCKRRAPSRDAAADGCGLAVEPTSALLLRQLASCPEPPIDERARDLGLAASEPCRHPGGDLRRDLRPDAAPESRLARRVHLRCGQQRNRLPRRLRRQPYFAVDAPLLRHACDWSKCSDRHQRARGR